jgi:AraC-like DNA-binding protein
MRGSSRRSKLRLDLPGAILEAERVLNELRRLVLARAHRPGRIESPLPMVSYHRADRPGPHTRSSTPALAIGVVVQGKKRAWVKERAFNYDSETYLVLTQEIDFESVVIEASPDQPYLAISILLPPELVVKTLANMSATAPVIEEPPAYVAKLDRPLVDVLCRLLRSLDDPAERAVVAPLALEELVFRLLRSKAAVSIRNAACRDGDQERVQRAMAFIREHHADRLTVGTIARHVAMSASHFAHRFREVARMSPMRYLKHVRLQQARVLLLNGLRAGEVAERVGYASPAHFARDFKTSFSLPPAEYVRSLQGSFGEHARSQDLARAQQSAR